LDLKKFNSFEWSTIEIGGYNKTYVAEINQLNGQENDTIAWLNLTSESHWEVELDNATFGSKELNITGEDVVLGSGSSFIYIPNQDLNEIIYGLADNGVNCTKDSSTLIYC
jgi:hypothetical protein